MQFSRLRSWVLGRGSWVYRGSGVVGLSHSNTEVLKSRCDGLGVLNTCGSGSCGEFSELQADRLEPLHRHTACGLLY